jgi:hypothetical protein
MFNLPSGLEKVFEPLLRLRRQTSVRRLSALQSEEALEGSLFPPKGDRVYPRVLLCEDQRPPESLAPVVVHLRPCDIREIEFELAEIGPATVSVSWVA